MIFFTGIPENIVANTSSSARIAVLDWYFFVLFIMPRPAGQSVIQPAPTPHNPIAWPSYYLIKDALESAGGRPLTERQAKLDLSLTERIAIQKFYVPEGHSSDDFLNHFGLIDSLYELNHAYADCFLKDEKRVKQENDFNRRMTELLVPSWKESESDLRRLIHDAITKMLESHKRLVGLPEHMPTAKILEVA